MTLEYLNKLLKQQNDSCSHCGCCLSKANASADRIDNSFGHIDSNITISCRDCNVARKQMNIDRFRELKRVEANPDKVIHSIDEEFKDIYHTMKANIVGGPSIIFTRYAKANKLIIRGGDKKVKKVIGYDANALYLWCLGNEMPCGRLTTIEPYDGMIDDIQNDKLFGFLECDIETPDI